MKLKLFLFVAAIISFSGCTTIDEEDLLPSSVTINRISVDYWPVTDQNGETWDLLVNTEPDIFITVKGGLIKYESPTYYKNPTLLNKPLNFDYNQKVYQSNFKTIHEISIWDYDDTSDSELMSTIDIVFEDYATIRQTEITKMKNNVGITLNVTWND